MRRLAACATLAAVLGPLILAKGPLSPPAAAQDRAALVLKKNDRDGDGRISRDEWQGPPRAFARIDTNGDDFMSPEELGVHFGTAGGKQGAGPGANPARAQIAWIDVHTHPAGGRGSRVDFSGSVRAAITAMEDASISRAILMPTPQRRSNRAPWTLEHFVKYAKDHPDRFAVMGGGGSLNLMIHDESPDGNVSDALRQRFERRANRIIQQGAVGFGEMSILHLSLVENHNYASVPGDHPLFLLLADIAAKHDVVIDVHFDPVVEDTKLPEWLSAARNPAILKRNIDDFEHLLEYNRNARIVWAHAGSDNVGHWTAQLTRRLLTKHPNLYISLRMSPGQGRVMRNFPLMRDGIKPPWLQVLRDFPDRFVLGGDQFFTGANAQGPPAHFAKGAEPIRNRTAMFLSRLPEDLARKIGYENATRIYKLSR
jgi:hypothetical protein